MITWQLRAHSSRSNVFELNSLTPHCAICVEQLLERLRSCRKVSDHKSGVLAWAVLLSAERAQRDANNGWHLQALKPNRLTALTAAPF